ncbi:MAG: helix-turn-helix domain-containing protein [Ilumatobacteraceae bacterium]
MEEGTLKSATHCEVTDDDDVLQWDTREDCEVRQILDRVADKWSLLVLALLARGTMRFSELHCAIDGVSQRMLTVTLRQLERDGLVLTDRVPRRAATRRLRADPARRHAAHHDPVTR